MFYSAGEIDRKRQIPDLIKEEFERFHELQSHYAADGQYPEEGLFKEKSSSSVIHKGLKDLGGSAVLGAMVIPEGHIITIPVSYVLERLVPVFYRMSPGEQSPFWSEPTVIAYRKEKAEDDETHPWKLPNEPDFDETLGVGIGITAMVGSYPGEPRGGYDISINLKRTKGLHRVYMTRSIYLQPTPNMNLNSTKARHDIPQSEQKDFMQLFREAAWDSVSEPA